MVSSELLGACIDMMEFDLAEVELQGEAISFTRQVLLPITIHIYITGVITNRQILSDSPEQTTGLCIFDNSSILRKTTVFFDGKFVVNIYS